MNSKTVKISYPAGAYDFVREAVNFAIQNAGEVRHVSAAELLENCRRFAHEQYGFLFPEVLKNWHINCADDIGNIVYELIEADKLSASPGDRREDFSIDFDLFDKNVFRVSYRRSQSEPLIID